MYTPSIWGVMYGIAHGVSWVIPGVMFLITHINIHSSPNIISICNNANVYKVHNDVRNYKQIKAAKPVVISSMHQIHLP